MFNVGLRVMFLILESKCLFSVKENVISRFNISPVRHMCANVNPVGRKCARSQKPKVAYYSLALSSVSTCKQTEFRLSRAAAAAAVNWLTFYSVAVIISCAAFYSRRVEILIQSLRAACFYGGVAGGGDKCAPANANIHAAVHGPGRSQRPLDSLVATVR